CGAIALPPQAFDLTLIGREVTAITTAAGMAMFGLLALPLLYWVLIFIPLPDALYPRWARDVREDRRKFPQTNPSQPSHPRDQPDSESRGSAPVPARGRDIDARTPGLGGRDPHRRAESCQLPETGDLRNLGGRPELYRTYAGEALMAC